MTISEWLNQQQQAVIFAKKLAGLTACSQFVRLSPAEKGKSDFVLRQQSPRASRLGVNYQKEGELLKALSSLTFVPQVYHCGEDGCLLHWVEGSSPINFDNTLLITLANHLATLHTFSVSPHLVKLDLSQRLTELWQALPESQKNAIHFAPPFPAIVPFTKGICHHDIHLNNLICQGEKVFLIDWEYAAVSDPALDIALFFHGNDLAEAQQAVFLSIYLQKTRFDNMLFKNKMAEYLPAIKQLNQLWFALSELL